MVQLATPLSVLLFAAFVLLVLSVISIPVTKFVPLGENANVKYGVFGYCQGDKCSKIGLGYPSGGILSDDTQQFDLPSAARRALSAILVIHPVAALLTLVMFCLAAAAHMRGPSHSVRYLLVVFIFLLLTFVVCLVAFVIDVLLFTPHLAWGSYLVLASAIILALCAVATCVLRRSIVSKKARQNCIADNAEMSGQNYFNREAQFKSAPVVASQPTVPSIGGGSSVPADNLPTFATFDSHKKDDQVSDERIPLTQTSPVEKPVDLANMNDTPHMAEYRRSLSQTSHGNPHNGMPDNFGPPMQPYGRGQGPPNQRGGRGGPYGRGGFDAHGAAGRGRGRGRGGFGPPPGRGGPRGRGGYGPPPRGAYGPPGGMRGGRGPPPPAAPYGNMGPGPGQYDTGSPSGAEYMPYGRPQSPQSSIDHRWNGSNHGSAAESYGLPRAESPPPLPGHGGHAMGLPRAESPPPLSSDTMTIPRAESPPPLLGHGGLVMGLPRAESPPPLPGHGPAVGIPRAESPPPLPGQATANASAVELEAARLAPPDTFGHHKQLRDGDHDVAGMAGLQQHRAMAGSVRDTFMSDISRYSSDEHYVPPRPAWDQNLGGHSSRTASPAHSYRPNPEQPMSPVRRGSRSDYYEDIDPKFDRIPHPTGHGGPMLHAPPPEPVYEDVHAAVGGARSPAESERSNFTSISQRGINPRWEPQPPMPNQGVPPRRPVPKQQRQDVLLNNNPDFQLPGARGQAPGRGGPGMIPGSAYPTGAM
ncbi:hypothetical protein E4U43_003079 [Claviceps pusilla]|uniref:PalI protein n=1 Tax=Claviceps pusilla TaxID=123648 RepID=A0A9P7SXV0_9HYPO|nr:hypothetical protein E4U43_003079 [Claviceps pusilla]